MTHIRMIIPINSPGSSHDHKVDSLTHSLQTSFDLEGVELKREIAKTLVPTVNRVKALYQVLDEKVDAAFGKGVLTFNNGCKEAEAMAIKEQDEAKHTITTAQVCFPAGCNPSVLMAVHATRQRSATCSSS